MKKIIVEIGVISEDDFTHYPYLIIDNQTFKLEQQIDKNTAIWFAEQFIIALGKLPHSQIKYKK